MQNPLFVYKFYLKTSAFYMLPIVNFIFDDY